MKTMDNLQNHIDGIRVQAANIYDKLRSGENDLFDTAGELAILADRAKELDSKIMNYLDKKQAEEKSRENRLTACCIEYAKALEAKKGGTT